MKKALALLLTFAMLFSLAACGGNQSEGGNDQPQATEPKYDYDASSLESMLTFIKTSGETTSAETETDADALIGKLGDSFDSYSANKTAVTDFYAAAEARGNELYAALQACSIDYFKCIAANGLDDYDVWDDAMGDFYDEWDDTMGEYYDAWDEAYGDVYDQCDDLISDASDDLDYDEYSDVWSAMYDEYSDAWSNAYEAYSAAWSKTYGDYSAVWSGFYNDKTDVDSILAEAAKENTNNKPDDDEEDNDDATVPGDGKPVAGAKPVDNKVLESDDFEYIIYDDGTIEIVGYTGNDSSVSAQQPPVDRVGGAE